MTLDMPASEDEVFTLSHTFGAPIQTLWNLWTTREHLMHWWGPLGMTLSVKSLELRPGGTFLYGVQTPVGLIMWGKLVYTDINASTGLGYVVSFCSEDGTVTRHPLAPLWPLEVKVTQGFEAKGDQTLLSSRSYPINATSEEHAIFKAGHAGMRMGLASTVAQLEAYLTTLKQAPRI
jgi:uncharacterized protein YndB with AHSA1/START domain